MPEADTERASVKTYVPSTQKAEWEEHAERLDMTLSEFLRTMVQAGRRGFLDEAEEGGSPGSNPRGDGLEDRVLRCLDEDGVVTWDELVTAVSGDIEDRLDDAVLSLTDAGKIRHDPRAGGYTRLEDT